MYKIKKYGKFKSVGKSKEKNQIILTHSSRNLEDYLSSLSFRYNGKYDKIPNYVVTKEGDILELISSSEYTKVFTTENFNKNSIIVCLENLGWLNREPLKDYYVNWIGDIYSGEVVEKKWRDYFFWHPYTEKQIRATAYLCNKLLHEFGLENDVIGHNTKINGIESFEGVVTKSNFESEYTDVSPAFNFESFIKELEDAKQT